MAENTTPNRVTIEGGLDGDQHLGFPNGVDSFSHPFYVKPTQVRWMENAVSQGAFIQTRPGYRARLAFDLADTDSEFYQWWISSGQPIIHPQMEEAFMPINGGWQMLFAISGSIWWCWVNYDGSLDTPHRVLGAQFDPHADQLTGTRCTQTASVSGGMLVNNITPRNLLVIQDGSNRSVIWDGSIGQTMNPEKRIHTDALGNTFYDDGWNETRIGLWCAWSGNRLYVCQGRVVRASDLGDPTHFTEELNLTSLPQITLAEDATGCIDRGTSGTTRSQLIVTTRNTVSVIWSGVQSRFPTASSPGWANTDDFKATIFSAVGCVAGKSLIVHRGLLYWKSADGLVLFDSTGTVNSSQNLPIIDQAMAYSKRLTAPAIRGADLTCAGFRGSYVFWSVPTGTVTQGRVYNSHTQVVDRQTTVVQSTGIDGPFSYGTTGWQGIWTGIRPVAWTNVPSSLGDRCYALSMDSDGVVRVWEAFQGNRADNGRRIPWKVETALHRVAPSVFDYSNFRHFRLLLDQIRGNLDVAGSWRGMRGLYHKILDTKITATPGSIFVPLPELATIANNTPVESFSAQGRTVISPDVRGDAGNCQASGVESEQTDDKDHAFGLLLEFTGHGALVAYRIAADQVFDNTEGEADPSRTTGVNENGFNIVSQSSCPRHVDGTTPDIFLPDTQPAEAFYPYISAVDDASPYSANPLPNPSLPIITMQPASQQVVPGSGVVFIVAAVGIGVSYQWYKDGVIIPGATHKTLTLSAVAYTDSGSYTVQVTNAAGMVESSIALLVVALPATVPVITVQPVGVSVTTGDPVTLSVTATGTAPLTYQWLKNGTPITGATSQTFTLIASIVGDSGIYSVQVTNSAGTATSANASVAVIAPMTTPIITHQPASHSVVIGQPVSFVVIAIGQAPLTYQWSKSGVNIAGATSSGYTIPVSALTDAGNYYVAVTNSFGTISSTTAVLTVIGSTPAIPVITTQPVSQSIVVGQPAIFGITATGTAPLTYQWSKSGVNIPGATSSVYSIPAAVLSDAGNYYVSVTNSVGSTSSITATLAVATTPTPVSAPVITVQPVTQSAVVGDSVTFSVVAVGSTPFTYQWTKSGVNIPGATSSSYNISVAALGDAGNYYVAVTNSAGTDSSTTAVLTVTASVVVPSITVQPAGLTVTSGQLATFSVTAAGTAPLTYQWKKNTVNISGATGSSYSVLTGLGDAGTYTVLVANSGGNVTSSGAVLVVNAPVLAPVITVQPSDQTVLLGLPFTLSVTATGTPTLNYQWYKNAVVVGGATAATYSVGSSALVDAGLYSVLVTNSAGTTFSNAANLTVSSSSPLVIITQPVSVAALTGNNVTFTVSASGAGTLTYQWKKGGVVIPGATSSTYSLTNVQPINAGTYTVVVTDVTGSITSSGAVLTVTAPVVAPTITTQPLAREVVEGSSVSFSVVAAGDPTLTYQWKKATAAISGATSATYTIASTVVGDAGDYTVTVTNGVGSVTSSIAHLTVDTTPSGALWYSTVPILTTDAQRVQLTGQLIRSLALLPNTQPLTLGGLSANGAYSQGEAGSIDLTKIPWAYLEALHTQVVGSPLWNSAPPVLSEVWRKPYSIFHNFTFNNAAHTLTFSPKVNPTDFDPTTPADLGDVYDVTLGLDIYINDGVLNRPPTLSPHFGYEGSWVGNVLTFTADGNAGRNAGSMGQGDTLLVSGNSIHVSTENLTYDYSMPASWLRPVMVMVQPWENPPLPGHVTGFYITDARSVVASANLKWMYLSDFVIASALP